MRSSWSDDAPSIRWVWAWAVLAMLLAAALTAAGGGRPVLFIVLIGVFVAWAVHDPLIVLPLIIVSQIIWLIGSYAPGGVNLLAPAKLALLLALAVWVVWAWRQRVLPTYAPHMAWLAAFLLVVLAGPLLTPALDGSLIGIGKYAMMWLPYLLVANLAIDRRGVTIVALSITLTATLAAALAMVERFMPGVDLVFDGVSLGAHVDDESLGTAIKRVTGGLGDANWFAYTMATTLPLCLYWFRAYNSFWVRAAAVGSALLQLAGLVLSYTRTPLVGLAGAVLFLVWTRRIALMPLLLALAIGGATAPAWIPAGFMDRFFSAKYVAEGSTPVRREILSMAVDLVRDRPLLGFGYEQFGPQFIARSTTDLGWELGRRDRKGDEPAHLLRAHNLYLDIWVQHGLLGLVPLLMMYGWLLRELWQLAHADPDGRDGELALCLLACLLAFYLCGIGGHSQELKIFWIIAGLVAALRRMHYSARASPQGMLADRR